VFLAEVKHPRFSGGRRGWMRNIATFHVDEDTIFRVVNPEFSLKAAQFPVLFQSEDNAPAVVLGLSIGAFHGESRIVHKRKKIAQPRKPFKAPRSR